MTENENDDNQSKPKQVIDLDAIGDTKSKKGYFDADSRVDFSLTSEQNKDRYISVGQIQELMKMPEAEKKRVMQASLTKEHRDDMDDFNKSLVEAGKKLNEKLKGVLGIGTKLDEQYKTAFDFVNRPQMVEAITPMIVAQPTANEQYKQTALLQDVVTALQAQRVSDDADVQVLIMPRYDKRKHILTFANTPIRIPVDTPAEIICNRMFRSGVPVKKSVDKGDLFDLLGLMEISPKPRRVKMLYNRVDGLNGIISKATNVTDLFCFVDKKLYFNTKYVKLPL